MASSPKYACFQRTSLFIALAVVFAACLFGLARLVFLWHYGSAFVRPEFASDLLFAFGTGVLFDIKVMVYSLSPLFLLGLVTLVLPGQRLVRLLERFTVPLVVTLLSLYLFILVIDHYYYAYFQSHINVLIFGFFEDDTWATLKGIWDDYPVVSALVGIAVFVWLLRLAVRRLYVLCGEMVVLRGWAARLAFMTLFTFLLFLGGRGSLGLQPLGFEDVDQSKGPFINQLSFNGVFALYGALWERYDFNLDTDPRKALADYGYQDAGRALRDYLGDTALRVSGDDEQVMEGLFTTTPRRPLLERDPPHVIVVMLESLGLNALEFHSRDTNLLGRLTSHFASDLVFRHFVSGPEGTVASLDGLLVSSPLAPLGQTLYRFGDYQSSVALPFKRAGYETIFISSGSSNWRKLQAFLPRLGFDKVLGRGAIHRTLAKTEDNAWGVFDEYLYDYALQVLREADAAGKRVFIFLLTTSNHSPYMLPSDYHPYPIALSDDLRKRLLVSPEHAKLMLTSYQYANDAFGHFLDQLKSGPMATRLVVGATGDHTFRGIFDYGVRGEQILAHGVPFYLYVPSRYMGGATVRTDRYGFHGDIFPTLYHRALSGARYFRSGRDLLGPEKEDPPGFGLHAFRWAFDGDGAVQLVRPMQYYEWDGDRLVPMDPPPDHPLRTLGRRANGFIALLNWYIRKCYRPPQARVHEDLEKEGPGGGE